MFGLVGCRTNFTPMFVNFICVFSWDSEYDTDGTHTYEHSGLKH